MGGNAFHHRAQRAVNQNVQSRKTVAIRLKSLAIVIGKFSKDRLTSFCFESIINTAYLYLAATLSHSRANDNTTDTSQITR